MKNKMILIAFLVFFLLAGCTAQTPALNGVKDEPKEVIEVAGHFKKLDPQWTTSLIYEHELVSPRHICIGPEGDAFVYDATKGIIYKVSRDKYTISEYFNPKEDLNKKKDVMISALAWQPGSKRFLLAVDNQIWYYSPDTGVFEMLSPAIPGQNQGWSYFEVNTADDSFFASSQTSTPVGRIYHFDKDLKAELIMSGTHGVYQTAYDSGEDALYYTETYTGTLKRIDLKTLDVKVVMNNLGIPGTYEPISVIYNPASKAINVFSPPNGFMDIEGRRLDRGFAGGGKMTWWIAAGKNGALILLQDAGANLVYLDATTGRIRALTPHINGFNIARNKEGEVLVYQPNEDGSQVMKIDASGLSDYYSQKGAELRSLMNDADGNVYAAWNSGKINIITGPGRDNAKSWANGISNVLAMAHNPYHNKIVVLRNSAAHTVEVVNIDIDKPTSRQVLASIKGKGILLPVIRVTCNKDDGTTYVLLAQQSDGPFGIYDILGIDTNGNQFTIHSDIFQDNRAITMPGFTYSGKTGMLLVSTIEDIRLFPVSKGNHTVLAVSNGAVDTFALTEDKDERIIGIQSGRVFQLEKRP